MMPCYTVELLFFDQLKNRSKMVVNKGRPLKRGLSALIQFFLTQYVILFVQVFGVYYIANILVLAFSQMLDMK